MSFKVAGTILGVTTLSAGANAYAAHEANKNAVSVDPAYQAFVNELAENDWQASEQANNFYLYGSADPYAGQNLPTTPYRSAATGKMGYYYDNKKGVYVDEIAYNQYSKNDKKALNDKRFTWTEVESPSTEGGYAAMEKNKLDAQFDAWEDMKEYALKTIANENAIVDSRYAAEQAGINETVQTSEGKIAATNAANKYVVETTPYKTEADIAKFQYDKNMLDLKTPVMSEYFAQAMEGIDPKESMDSATAEVMKANDATKAGMQRDAMAMGIAPGSERYNAMMKEDRNQTVGAIADARTAARKQAEDTSFDRLSAAMNQS